MNKFLIIVCLVIISCNEGTNVKKDLAKLCLKPIKIPTNIIVNYNGKDSLMDDFLTADLKFVIYFDSTNCISCFSNKLDVWQLMFKYADLFNGELKFYFIFYPPKNGRDGLNIELRNLKMNYPVLIDEKGDFERLNPHLPKNKQLHTFLLDENNNVILVGNPLNNKEVEKLFYAKTQELLHK